MTQLANEGIDNTWAEGFLRQCAPNVLREIELTESADSGRIALGAQLPVLGEWRRAARLREAILKQLLAVAEPVLKVQHRKLFVASRWQLVTDIVAVIGPASIFVALKSDAPKPAQYLSGSFTLLAAILSVIAHYVARTPVRAGSVLEHHTQLVQDTVAASELLREIAIRLQSKLIGPDDQNLLKTADEVCRRIEEAVRFSMN